MSRIYWSADERALVVNTIASYLKTNGKTVSDVTAPGWFPFYIKQAQVFLPEDRRRFITGENQIPWFLPALRAATGVGPQTDVEAYVRANLDAVIAELRKTHVVSEKTTCIARDLSALAKPASKQRQMRVLVVGLLPAQAATVSAKYGDVFDLHFVDSGNHNRLTQGTPVAADYAVGLTSFVDHAQDAYLRKTYKARYHPTYGGVSAVIRVLGSFKIHGTLRPEVVA